MNNAVAVVSVSANVALAVALFYAWQWRAYQAGMREPDEKLVRSGLAWYALIRDEDVSKVSGEGLICEVAQFSDGHAAVHWIGSKYPWTTPCPEGVDAVVDIHGHGGKTRLVPIKPL